MATSATSYNGITWTWLEDVPVHWSVMGDPCVVAPGGITLVSVTPASTQDPVSGRIRHGAMLNPTASIGKLQGFDTNVADNTYVAALNAVRPGGSDLSESNPLSLPAGSSLVSSITLTSAGNRPQLQHAAVLTVLAADPPANFFRPPYCGTDKTIIATSDDIDYDLLPSLPKPAGYSWPTDLAAVNIKGRLARVYIEINTNFEGRSLHPTVNQDDYGQEISKSVGLAMLYSCLDYTPEQKANVVLGLIQYGIDIYGARQSGGYWRTNGGHNMGRKAALLYAGHLLGAPQLIAAGDPNNGYRFQEDENVRYVDSALVDRTQNNNPGSSQWRPDNRAIPIRYTTDMIGTPEWGIEYRIEPQNNNAYWQATYRKIANNHMVEHALVMHLLGLREAWNMPAWFDFIDRFVFVERARGIFSSGINDIQTYAWRAWDAFRELPGHSAVWGKDAQIPTISGNPADRTIEAGQSTVFSVAAYGVPPPTFQWSKNGAPIGGATGASYTIPSVAGADAGSYTCAVTNSTGTMITWPALLTVTGTDPEDTTPPVFLTGPIAANITETTAEIRATLNESGTLYWLMLADGASAPSAADVEAGTGGISSGNVAAVASTLAVAPVTGGTASTARDVWVVAKDALGNLQSSPVKVDVTFADAPPDPDPVYPGLASRSRRGGKNIIAIL